MQFVAEQRGELVEAHRVVADGEDDAPGRGNADAVAPQARLRARVERGMDLAASHQQRAGLRGQENLLAELRVLRRLDDPRASGGDRKDTVGL